MRATGLWLSLYRPTVQPTNTAQNAQQPATRQHLFIRMAPAECCPLHSTPGTRNAHNRQVAQPISDSEPAEPELMPSRLSLGFSEPILYCLLALPMCHLDKRGRTQCWSIYSQDCLYEKHSAQTFTFWQTTLSRAPYFYRIYLIRLSG